MASVSHPDSDLKDKSDFLASLMPKKEIAADKFIQDYPDFDGRGTVIAIFDSGVDPSVDGLKVTSNGKPKILDVIDCTGDGDINTSTVVEADSNGCIRGASGASLVVNSSWTNPTGKWHVGCKRIYELFTDTQTRTLMKERKKKWDIEKHAEIAQMLEEFDKEHTDAEDLTLKKAREDLNNRVDNLCKQADDYYDEGPIIDGVVWNDGEIWRVALDTQSLEDEPRLGKLADFTPLANYSIEQKYATFSRLDACTCVVNVYNEGNILSIVTESSPHGTHVAGIAAAFHPKEPLLNGVAPGAQLISCKIGDSRLKSMETGTGLTRAVIAAVKHKCDLINMSYGEPTLLPNYGRFVDLVDEMVNKHRMVFVSSAGNEGPALSTMGAPGGTTSSIIGIGAYVSPEMATGAHGTVEAPPKGLPYTWSSRGPTTDGDLGVSVSAPGGAVAPVPTRTLQRRMLMSGTSMSAPSACGGIALLISAMKDKGIPVSPYSIQKAIENTSDQEGSLPEDKLSLGQGLLQVDKAFEYIQKLHLHNVPCVRYQLKIKEAYNLSPTYRGIYLREAIYCQQSTEWTVKVKPKFHEDARNLKQLVSFQECIKLHSTHNIVKAPEYLLLTHNGSSFNIVVDPSNLGDGLHYYEVYGIECEAPWRGPLFRVPITITKPTTVKNRPPLISFRGMSFQPGHIERRYLEVPFGATWVEATMRTSGFDTPRSIHVNTVQISPLRRPMKWENVVTFLSPEDKRFTFQVEGGQTMELTIAQSWSSGFGSHKPTTVDIEIGFHGIITNKDDVVLYGSEAPTQIDAEALLSSEDLVPAAKLTKIRIPYFPVEAKLTALMEDRDKLPSGKRILALNLIYKFKLEDSSEIKPYIPLLNNRLYDNKIESQFYTILDSDKIVYSMGDVYPEFAILPKGEFELHLCLRHDNVRYLQKMKGLLLYIERKLEDEEVIELSFFSQPDGPVTGNGNFESSTLVPGKKASFYVAPPTKVKLSKNFPYGSVLVGAISYGKVSSVYDQEGENPENNPAPYMLSFIVLPSKHDKDTIESVFERLEEESENPGYSLLLDKILKGLDNQTIAEED